MGHCPGEHWSWRVCRDRDHRFATLPVPEIKPCGGSASGDVHAGVTVQHRSRVAAELTQRNLHQVHLIQSELLDELRARGFEVTAGDLGENITTSGIDLLALPAGAILRIGPVAVVRVTGLRNPCLQIEDFRSGLLKEVARRGPDGSVVRKAGVMGVVVRTGTVRSGDQIDVELPAEPHVALDRV